MYPRAKLAIAALFVAVNAQAAPLAPDYGQLGGDLPLSEYAKTLEHFWQSYSAGILSEYGPYGSEVGAEVASEFNVLVSALATATGRLSDYFAFATDLALGGASAEIASITDALASLSVGSINPLTGLGDFTETGVTDGASASAGAGADSGSDTGSEATSTEDSGAIGGAGGSGGSASEAASAAAGSGSAEASASASPSEKSGAESSGEGSKTGGSAAESAASGSGAVQTNTATAASSKALTTDSNSAASSGGAAASSSSSSSSSKNAGDHVQVAAGAFLGGAVAMAALLI